MRDTLERAVLALAQPAEVQLGLFPDFVPTADELALSFEDGLYELAGHEDEFAADQLDAVDALNALLIGISGQQNASFWTDEALVSHPIWEEIRTAARHTAAAFGWELRVPDLSGAIFIRAGN